MSRTKAILGSALLALYASSGTSWGVEKTNGNKPVTVANPAGDAIETIDGNGHATAIRPAAGTLVPAPASKASVCTDTDPSSRLRSSKSGGSFLECAAAEGDHGRIVRESRDRGILVDDTGVVHRSSGTPARSAKRPGVIGAGTGEPLLSPPTIDRMTTAADYGYPESHDPGGALVSLGSAVEYFLSDGSTWQSGAGSYQVYQVSLDHVEVSGDTVRYVLVNPGPMYQQTDFDSGDHSAQGSLAAQGSLVLEATIGSATAVLHGGARIVSNDSTYYGDRFNFYSAPVGSVVPFEVTYTLVNTTWAADSFDQTFDYTESGSVDFAHPISLPQLQSVSIAGSAQVPSESTVQFRAVAQFENNVTRDVTDSAAWSVDPSTLASVSQGLLTTQPISTAQETLVLHVEYTAGGMTVRSDKTIVVRPGGSADQPDAWETFQGNASHTGYVPISLEPDVFSLLWQRAIGSGAALNPVTAADGRVFVSLVTYFNDIPTLFVLDARDGETLWSKGFGDVFSVNPPSFAYGNVYIQTGHDGSLPLLHAYDAATGAVVFEAPFDAQWERYYAPTIFNGVVYVNAGYYGGMYGFDAFSGEQRWFMDLPQYDQWTPAVDANYAYAYVGEYSPGLYVANRLTGASAFTIPDPHFDWNGWSMNLAPVLGAHDDLLAIHNGRLLSFGLSSRSIRYELSRSFAGQPSVSHDTVYAIDGGTLIALDEVTGNMLWSWSPPEGSLTGPLLVTDTHLFATTATTTYAVELLSRSQAWSFPVSGNLTLGNETLYVASSDGVLTAISMPAHTQATLTGLEITGPARVTENSSVQYAAIAHYSDGRARDRTALAQWTVDPDTYANFAAYGVLNVSELLAPTQNIVVHARYTEGDATVDASFSVKLVIGVTLPEFTTRSLTEAVSLKRQVLDLLHQALIREEAVRRVWSGAASSHEHSRLNDLRRAILEERLAVSELEDSIENLRRAKRE
jgi:PQQ-like domain